MWLAVDAERSGQLDAGDIHVVPVLSVISRELDGSVAHPRPDDAAIEAELGERVEIAPLPTPPR